MSSRYADLRHRLTAAAASVEPGPLLEWAQVSRPYGPVAMRAGFRTVNGVRIRYAESDGPPEQTVLLTSPWPGSMYAFAPIWPALADRFRVVAVDLPGFGGLEGQPELRSPRAIGAFLVSLIDEWALGRPHLVGADVGTLAALFAALLSPGSLASVAVGSGGAAVLRGVGAPVHDWASEPKLERVRNLEPKRRVGGPLPTVTGQEFSQDIHGGYVASCAGARFVEPMDSVRRYPDEVPELAERLGEIKTPVMVFAGSRDRVAPLADTDFLAQHLRNCRLATLDAGHFVWEEVPDAFGQLLGDWIDEHKTPTEVPDEHYADR